LPVDRSRIGGKYLIVSPIYSIFDQASEDVTAQGGLVPVFKCLVAFACCNLEEFNVPAPPPQLFKTLDENIEEEEEEGKMYEEGIHSIGSYFDQFGIGQALKNSVCSKPELVFLF
jgi:hypothetical protein